MNQNKTSFITYIDKIEKAYLKAVKTIYRPHFERRGPERKDIFKVLKNNINNTSFVLSNNLLNRAKQIADLINLRTKYPDHFLYEILFKLDDLLAFIVNGYYSTNWQSYSENLFEFFDLILLFNDAITPYIKQDFHEHKFSYLIENKTQWFQTTRHSFRELFKLDSYGNYQSFESDRSDRDLRFTIKIVEDKLQIVYKKNYKPTTEFEDYYRYYIIIDEFNKKNYEFKLNFKKIFEDNVEKKDWYKHYLSRFYFSFESINFPDSIQALGKQKSLLLKGDLDQFFSKHSDDKTLLKEEIFKRIEQNSEVDNILDKGYLKHLNNKELSQLLTPFIKLLEYYDNQLNREGNQRFYSFTDKLLKGYLAFWREEKNLDKHGLRFDGYYHNFYYSRLKGKEEELVNTDIKFYNDGVIKFGDGTRNFDNGIYAKGRYIYHSTNKIYFFLRDRKNFRTDFPNLFCEGIVQKDMIEFSHLYGYLETTSLHGGKYKFQS